MSQLQVDHATTQVTNEWETGVGGCDGLLWVEWLKNYSLVLFDFNNCSTFTQDGKSVSLKGTTNSTELHLISSSGLLKVFRKKVGKLMGFLFLITTEVTNQVCLPPLVSSLIKEFTDIFTEHKGLHLGWAHNHHVPVLPMAKHVNLKGYRYPCIPKKKRHRRSKACISK